MCSELRSGHTNPSLFPVVRVADLCSVVHIQLERHLVGYLPPEEEQNGPLDVKKVAVKD